MSEDEETYCRLCAEPTAKTQLVSCDDDVGINSKITTKMMWINIDTTSNILPNAICFSCFDLLERTWIFLHNVRTAQIKLLSIFTKKSDEASVIEVKLDETTGKPMNVDWNEVLDTKKEVKIEESTNNIDIPTVDPTTLINVNINDVKTECDSSDDVHNHSHGLSSDSDVPLHLTVKKRKSKKRKRNSFEPEILIADLAEIKTEAITIDPDSLCMSWDELMCRCAHCDALCKNITALRLHSLEIHNKCCMFKCSDCSKVIVNYKMFINHVRIHKKLLKYCCEICNKQFTLTAYYKKHRNTEHRDIYLHMCQNCGSSFATEELLEDHIASFSKGFIKHRKHVKHTDATIKCEHCDKEFKSRSNLQQHKILHAPRSRDFSCHICGKLFFTKGTLSTHLMTHEDTRPFKCEFCPMAFRARGNLQSHSSLHSGVKPFVCEQCGKSFRIKRHLKSHSIMHTDLMPYVCEFCNKSFRFKTRLNLHLRQHTGAKPHSCIYCQRSFTNGSNFKKHMRRRHNIDTSKKKYTIVNEQGIETNNSVQTE